jgi:hypothetical protein
VYPGTGNEEAERAKGGAGAGTNCGALIGSGVVVGEFQRQVGIPRCGDNLNRIASGELFTEKVGDEGAAKVVAMMGEEDEQLSGRLAFERLKLVRHVRNFTETVPDFLNRLRAPVRHAKQPR